MWTSTLGQETSIAPHHAVTTRSIFGLIRRTHCDRCGNRIKFHAYHLCSQCSRRDPAEVRRLELLSAYSAQGDISCCLCATQLQADSCCDVCVTCISSHIDNSHFFFGDYGSGERVDTDVTGIRYRIRHCFGCGGILVIREDQNYRTFTYYRRGNDTPVDPAYECPKEDLEESQSRIRECQHHWCVVADTSRARDFSKEAEDRILFHAIPLAKNMGIDEETFIRSDGRIYNWCSKCGCYIITSPEDKPMVSGDWRLE